MPRLACLDVPELSLADGTKVAAFTDLKLRDLGSSGPEEKHHLWRTRPFWGVASTSPYLHDGSALASLSESIARHGADPSAQAFAKLPAEGQGEVLVFLLSLTRSPQIQIAGR